MYYFLGLKQATPIQQACIPSILDGKDCIGAAKTGSGKTFAFALPILEKLSEEPTSHFALILTPTHELAYQVSLPWKVFIISHNNFLFFTDFGTVSGGWPTNGCESMCCFWWY